MCYIFVCYISFEINLKNVVRCAICYHLYSVKNMKNTHGGCFTKINTPPWVFFTFFKLYKCYQIAQRTINDWKNSTLGFKFDSKKTRANMVVKSKHSFRIGYTAH